MIYDFDLLTESLNNLEDETFPEWGKMNSSQMMIHCNNFIEVSIGNQKISFWTKVYRRIFGFFFEIFRIIGV